jgi:hypothetical protein
VSDRRPREEVDDGDDGQRHDRRYQLFAVVFAAVVLLFAALSITIVVVSS